MQKKSQSEFLMLCIVGVVAIIALITMYHPFSYSQDQVGEATKFATKQILEKESYVNFERQKTEHSSQEMLPHQEDFLIWSSTQEMSSKSQGDEEIISFTIDWDWFKGRYKHRATEEGIDPPVPPDTETEDEKKARDKKKEEILGKWDAYKEWVEKIYKEFEDRASSKIKKLKPKGHHHGGDADRSAAQQAAYEAISAHLDEKIQRIAGDFSFEQPKLAWGTWVVDQVSALGAIADGGVTGDGSWFPDYSTLEEQHKAFEKKLDEINQALTDAGVPTNDQITSTSTTPNCASFGLD